MRWRSGWRMRWRRRVRMRWRSGWRRCIRWCRRWRSGWRRRVRWRMRSGWRERGGWRRRMRWRDGWRERRRVGGRDGWSCRRRMGNGWRGSWRWRNGRRWRRRMRGVRNRFCRRRFSRNLGWRRGCPAAVQTGGSERDERGYDCQQRCFAQGDIPPNPKYTIRARESILLRRADITRSRLSKFGIYVDMWRVNAVPNPLDSRFRGNDGVKIGNNGAKIRFLRLRAIASNSLCQRALAFSRPSQKRLGIGAGFRRGRGAPSERRGGATRSGHIRVPVPTAPSPPRQPKPVQHPVFALVPPVLRLILLTIIARSAPRRLTTDLYVYSGRPRPSPRPRNRARNRRPTP